MWSLNLQFWSDAWLQEEMSFKVSVEGGGAGHGAEEVGLMVIEDGSESDSDGKATPAAPPGSPVASSPVAVREEAHPTMVIIRTVFEFFPDSVGCANFLTFPFVLGARRKPRPPQNGKPPPAPPQMMTKSLN